MEGRWHPSHLPAGYLKKKEQQSCKEAFMTKLPFAETAHGERTSWEGEQLTLPGLDSPRPASRPWGSPSGWTMSCYPGGLVLPLPCRLGMDVGLPLTPHDTTRAGLGSSSRLVRWSRQGRQGSQHSQIQHRWLASSGHQSKDGRKYLQDSERTGATFSSL